MNQDRSEMCGVPLEVLRDNLLQGRRDTLLRMRAELARAPERVFPSQAWTSMLADIQAAIAAVDAAIAEDEDGGT